MRAEKNLQSRDQELRDSLSGKCKMKIHLQKLMGISMMVDYLASDS